MSPLGIVTCTVELPSDAEADGESDVDTLGSSGATTPSRTRSRKPKSATSWAKKQPSWKQSDCRAVRILRRVDALIVTMIAPESVGRVRPVGEARTPRIGRQLPAGGARRVAVLAGDVRGRDEPGDDRRDRRRGLTELLLPALRRRRPCPHDMIRGRLDLLVGGVVRQACHPREQDRESLLVQLLAAAEVLRRRSAAPADRAVARERAGRIRRPVSGRGCADELRVPQELRHAQRLTGIARGDQSRRLLVEVAAPDPVVAVIRLISVYEVAPRRGEPCDAGAAECLVLGGVQRHRRNIINPTPQRIRRHAGRGRAQPVDIVAPAFAVGGLPIRESGRKRSLRRRKGRRRVAAISERDRERRIGADIADLAALDDIAVAGAVESADEGHVLLQFDDAVARLRRKAVVVRDEAVRTSDLQRRDDGRGRAKKGSRPAGHERRIRSVPPGGVVRPAAGDAWVRVQVEPVGAAVQRTRSACGSAAYHGSDR